MGDSFSIEVSDLVRRFDSVTAVDHFSLRVRQGSIHGLLGPDGAGKTTLLRSLAGAISIQGGSVTIAGYDLSREQHKIRPLIGYMPQRFALYEDLTVNENLNFFADMYGVTASERAERLPRLIAFTRLAGHEKKLGKQLSGGMKQKLALCTVLVHQPHVLLLDEPSTGVDPVSRGEFWQILGGLKQQGVSVLVSTPYMDEAERCDALTMMTHGKCLLDGSPEELRRRFPYKMLEITTERAFDSRRALAGSQHAINTVIHGTKVHVVVADRSAEAEIRKTLLQHGITPSQIQPVEPGLEDVFVHELSSRGSAVLASAICARNGVVAGES